MEWLPILLIAGLCTRPSFCANYRKHSWVETPKSWADAQSYCRERGGDLATIDDMGAQEALMRGLSGKRGRAWLGIYSGATPSWKWSLADVDFYRAGERDFRAFLSQAYGEGSASYSAGHWETKDESLFLSVMCYDASRQGKDRYVFVQSTFGFPAAQVHCRTHHTDIVSVRNQMENDLLREITDKSFRIGLYLDDFAWSDGRESSLRFWTEGHGVRVVGSGRCGLLDVETGHWESQSCEEALPFLCAFGVPTQKRVLKVRVNSEGLRDLNDAATKAAILQQIQQMTDGRTVSWNTPLGGEVFTKEQGENDTD